MGWFDKNKKGSAEEAPARPAEKSAPPPPASAASSSAASSSPASSSAPASSAFDAARAAPAAAKPPAAPTIKGSVDLVEASRVHGWTRDTAAADVDVKVAVFVGEQCVGAGVANKFRPDLEKAGFAGGKCAFVLDLTRPLRAGEVVKVVATAGDKRHILSEKAFA